MDLLQYSAPKEISNEQVMPQIETNITICSNYYTALNSPNAEIDLPKYVIANAYKLIELGVTKKDQAALQIIVDSKFLTTLKNCIAAGNITFSEEINRYQFNRICYDYNRTNDHNLFIQNILIDIVCCTNQQIFQTLLGFGLTKDQAGMIIAARYSTSEDLCINYKRVIRIIQSSSSTNMDDEEVISKIFGKLCNKSIRDLFIACMTDRYSTFYSSLEEEIYSIVGVVVLNIVESLPMDGIRTVLTTYSQVQRNTDKKPRFMLKSISVGDYPRINQMIEILEMEGYYLY